ncbi:MAG: ABC transporter ATP-binding protein [Acholeplasmatales bacterium]|jgi:ABC-2 type transport system ATP-binding protein|nr:ABC transporter ATP-binding protein [Acholeplasmatales bacterium]
MCKLIIDKYKKKYTKDGPYVVDNISFSVHEKEIVGLLGHNGAGKSTIIKSIVGILNFDSGRILLDDIDLLDNPIMFKKEIGYVSDNHLTFEKMTGYEYLKFIANIFKVSKNDFLNEFEKLENIFNLGSSLESPILFYSHGMKQKISIMASLIHKPKFWILDEPTNGLDPEIFQKLITFIMNYKNEGNSILFSSHNLEMVSKICDRVILIENGSIVKEVIGTDKFSEIDLFFNRGKRDI